MLQIKTKAIVLKSINYGDTSKIVTFYTREYGYISVIAKGARKIKSIYSGNLEPLNLLEAIIYVSANRELQVLGQISLENSFQQIRLDLDKTACALTIIELIQTFIRHSEKDQIFFDFVSSVLSDIQTMKKPIIMIWFFMLKLASYLGFKPEFRQCNICNKKITQNFNIFKAKDGIVICKECNISGENQILLPANVLKFLSRLQNTHHKKVINLIYPEDHHFNYTEFIISYLQLHTHQTIQLSALKYFS